MSPADRVADEIRRRLDMMRHQDERANAFPSTRPSQRQRAEDEAIVYGLRVALMLVLDSHHVGTADAYVKRWTEHYQRMMR